MGNYNNVRAKVPEGIGKKRAFLVGGGIGSLAAAFYLIHDGHMDGKQITVFENLSVLGGAMDGSGTAKNGFLVRGGREMEEHYECSWDLFSHIPTIENPSRTVLEDLREVNLLDPNVAACRLMQNCGEKIERDTLGLSGHNIGQLRNLFMATEAEVEGMTIEEYFDDSFLATDFWYYWRSMFAFENYQSVLEMKRYMHRFIHHFPGLSRLKGILFSRYNQYESMILPLQKWLENKGVTFVANARVEDLALDIQPGKKTVTAIHVTENGVAKAIPTTEDDLVFFTNGSMTENSTLGSMDTPAKVNRGPGACWELWKKLAFKDPAFGRPEVFCGDIDKTKWESFTITCTDSPMEELLKKLTGRDPRSGKLVTGGIMTAIDSAWLLSVTCHRQPHFASQPENTIVLWAYGLLPDKAGNHVPKKMEDCTGEELLRELLYHLGAGELTEKIIATSTVIPCMMPYITSQFMPRRKGDRPAVVPEGSTNLAFLGQFVEIPGDCVFTVEYSVRSAMTAVYTLLALDKQPPEVHPSQYDLRVIAAAVKTMYGGKHMPGEMILRHFLKNTSMEGLI
ncbi:MAG: oleate hydratase [Methanomicrobiales archaeon HGW-Methanomicrobiales-1]|jgi:oleate hydratase|nr:MAG: oleate hydratase [Methanomicrobiales archaeon HGW-Methanomicrobiales-1]